MAKTLTQDQVKMRLEMIDFVAQGVRTQVTAGYYDAEQVTYLTQQLERVAKFLCVRN
jgi:hypothetical protein